MKESVCVDTPKHAHGSFKNVLLTDEEYKSLKDKWTDADDVIDELSEAIASNPEKYDRPGNTVAKLTRFYKQKHKNDKPPEKRKMLTLPNKLK